jgi:hypothetical protein
LTDLFADIQVNADELAIKRREIKRQYYKDLTTDECNLKRAEFERQYYKELAASGPIGPNTERWK